MAKKVLLMPLPLQGHVTQFARLAHFLAGRPGYEVHFAAAGGADLPASVRVHDDASDDFREQWAQGFRDLARTAKDWHSSMTDLITGSDVDGLCRLYLDTLDLVKRLQPDVVVSDAGRNFTNHLHTLCRGAGIPLVLILCPGRPDPVYEMPADTPNLDEASKVAEAITSQARQMSEKAGGALEQSDQPLTLLTGSKALVAAAPADHQLFVGSLLAVARSPEESAEGPALGGDLAAWVSRTQSLGPIVYVAFGTLVVPEGDLVRRLVEALDGGRWRVLWSLPATAHHLLPPGLDPDRWRVETFVPQLDVLRHEQVACFFSHCGASSVHEAMYNGVPMVCMPFYCDQYEWAASVCDDVGAGIQVDKFASDAAALRRAVAEVVEAPLYRQKARAAAQRMRHHTGALAKAFGIQENREDQVSASVIEQILRSLMNGENPGANFPALGASTGQLAKL